MSTQTPQTTYLIIGASRGLGHALAKHLSSKPSNKIIATVRSPTPSLTTTAAHQNITTLTLDQTNPESVATAASQLSTPIDVLIVNAGIGSNEKILSTSESRWQEYLNVNVLGVARVINAFLPHLRKGREKKIVLMSSWNGSLTSQVGNQMGFVGPYAVTKAAVNMLAVQLHNELHESEGFVVVLVHPGWVATDMGNIMGDGGIPVEESANGVISVVEGLNFEDSAKFYDYQGQILPW